MGSWEKRNTIWQYRENGALVTGWKQISGKWYLFGDGGNMLLGWQKEKDRWYYLKQEADCRAGEPKNEYGFMLTGWQQLGGKWYFFHEDGSMAACEWVKDRGKWYFLRSNGEMARNQMRSYKGKSYYFKADGSMAVSEVVFWNGERYHADQNGACLKAQSVSGGHNVTRLHPRLKRLQKKLIAQCAARGLPIRITQEIRTAEEQDALYALGRTKPGNIVTNARGSSYSSHHQWGTAFDFCREDGKPPYDDSDRFFEKVGAMGKALGLEWGGDWKSIVDKPHFQLPDWGSGTAKLRELYCSPERFEKSWEV